MLVAVAARLREATTLVAVAQAVVEELAAFVRSTALVLVDADHAPRAWIGDTTLARDDIHAFLDAPDPMLARVCQTRVPEVAQDVWFGPIVGVERVIGVLRVEGAAHRELLAIVAAQVAIQIAHAGLDDPPELATLTARQREVAELVARGCTNAEVGRMLAISPNAVKKHVSRVLAQLEVSNRTELAALTARWQIPSGNHQILPPSLQRVLRNPAKSDAPKRDADGA